MRVLTFNLNGIRAAWRKGAEEWLQSAGADIVCMQEVRASAEDLSEGMRRPAGLRGEFNLPLRRGYSGVGLLAKKQPRRVVRRFAPPKKESVWDEEGRFLRMDFEKFSAVSLYLPSGSSGDARQAVKETAMAELMPWLAARRKEADKTGREFLVCGDFNIAHTEKDIRNWRGNRKNSGFLPHEREWLSRLFSEAGWTDVFAASTARTGNTLGGQTAAARAKTMSAGGLTIKSPPPTSPAAPLAPTFTKDNGFPTTRPCKLTIAFGFDSAHPPYSHSRESGNLPKL